MNQSLFRFSLLALLGACLLLASCSLKETERDEPVVTPTSGLKAAPEAPVEREHVRVDMQIPYFDYDKSYLRKDAIRTIEHNLKWLKNNPEANVQLEGHCDERGTPEYNYHLGEKRAEIVKAFLVRHGISADRLSTISYGAEAGRGEHRMASNRRVLFVVVYKD